MGDKKVREYKTAYEKIVDNKSPDKILFLNGCAVFIFAAYAARSENVLEVCCRSVVRGHLSMI